MTLKCKILIYNQGHYFNNTFNSYLKVKQPFIVKGFKLNDI